MSKSSIKSATSRKSRQIRAPFQPYPQDRLCRYLLDGNRRCRSIAANTGSGLCRLHDNQLIQSRDAQSHALGEEALGSVTDLNTAVAIHSVLGRVVMLGLHRRYSNKEVAVFTYALNSLQNSRASAHDEISAIYGYQASRHHIVRAVEAEPAFHPPRPPRPPKPSAPAAARVAPSEHAPAPTPTPHLARRQPVSGAITESDPSSNAMAPGSVPQSSASADAGLPAPDLQPPAPPVPAPTATPSTTPSTAPSPASSSPEPVLTGTGFTPSMNPTKKYPPRPVAPPPADDDDDSISYTHMQSYGGIVVPLHGRLKITP